MAWPQVVMALAAAASAANALMTKPPTSEGETSSTPSNGGIGESTIGSRGGLDESGVGSLLSETPVGPPVPIQQQTVPQNPTEGMFPTIQGQPSDPFAAGAGGDFGWLETLKTMGPAIAAVAPLLKGEPDKVHRQGSSGVPISPGGSARNAGLQAPRDRLSAGDILSRIRSIS